MRRFGSECEQVILYYLSLRSEKPLELWSGIAVSHKSICLDAGKGWCARNVICAKFSSNRQDAQTSFSRRVAATHTTPPICSFNAVYLPLQITDAIPLPWQCAASKLINKTHPAIMGGVKLITLACELDCFVWRLRHAMGQTVKTHRHYKQKNRANFDRGVRFLEKLLPRRREGWDVRLGCIASSLAFFDCLGNFALARASPHPIFRQ